MPPPVDTNKVAVAVPPDARVTLVGVRVATGAFLVEGEMLAERVTIPANPLRLVRVIAELADCPLIMVSDDGVALMVKSGGAETVTFASRIFSGSIPLGMPGLVTVTQMLSLLLPGQVAGNSMKDPAVAPMTL